MRLVGYTGPNLILSPLGVYWSGRTALKVFRQQDKIENGAIVPQVPSPIERDNSSNKNTSKMHSSQEGSTDGKNFPHSIPISTSDVSDKPPDHAKYRVAAKRLASFALGFLLINVIASFSTLWGVIKNNKSMSSRISSSDIIGSLLGISIFLIFGGFENLKLLFGR
ncbi:3298_t:CDS:2 [Diversispora eburnea]|uniref:3298_t:CDS:1 n=1 Tax=Diversispora eburnea TaxID=1213867 RepID=A0A9N9AWG3_9GLOM|nr:3298_t:CDS:2 [Diversispora eburnea]